MNTTVAEYPLDEWKKVMDLNLNSVFYCCKAVVPFMIKNDYVSNGLKKLQKLG